MATFTCSICNCDTPVLVTTGGRGLACRECAGSKTISHSPNFHQKINLGNNTITEIEKRHISTRTIGADGQSVINKNTGKNWSF